MALSQGTRLGPYEVVAPIGAGGMGEVYKARDTRLNRTVAIKILSPHVADSLDMKQRFDREAQTIASLNHPHICTLHDIGVADGGDGASGATYLVMEYLEGETLAKRLERGPLALDEAFAAAIAVLEALDKAHRQGVIHRDLKPSNVMLARSRTSSASVVASTASPAPTRSRSATTTVKLLDFGLAKWAPSGQPGSLSALPTRMDVTAQGTMVGTLQYMSPEQIEGREADARADIFAFGVLLYEILTGRRAFEGKTQASLIGAIMTADPPPLSTVQPGAPASLDHIVSRCLAKDPEDRWQATHTLLNQLRWLVEDRNDTGPSPEAAAGARRKDRALRLSLAGAMVLAVGLAAPAFLYLKGPVEPDAFTFRSPIVGAAEWNHAISPDGRTIVFAARPDTQLPSSLFVRRVGSVTSQKLAGTDDAAQPFWSPDSRSIGFVTGGKLKRIDASGGAPKEMCDAAEFSGGTWSREGAIVFGAAKGLRRVSAEGGTATEITSLEQGETGHFWPSFLPTARTSCIWRGLDRRPGERCTSGRSTRRTRRA